MTENTVPISYNYFEVQPKVRLLRFLLRATERLCPMITVGLADRIIATPSTLHKNKWQEAKTNGWQVCRWPFEDAELTVYTEPAAVVRSGPPVLLVHGWGGQARDMLVLADTIAACGLSPVLVDLPAHGYSRGRVSNLAQFARAIEYMTAIWVEKGTRWGAVIAHSLAGSATAFAAGRGLAADRLVLIAPPAFPSDFTRLFAKVFGISEASRATLQQRIEAREGLLMRQFEPSVAGPKIKQPTLIIHDRGDRINAFLDGEAFRNHIRYASVFATDGLGHRKVLQNMMVVDAISEFISTPIDKNFLSRPYCRQL